MIARHIEYHRNTALFAFGEQFFKVPHRAVIGVDVVIIVDIVTVIRLRRINRQKPNTRDTEVVRRCVVTVIQIIEFFDNAGKVADSVAVRIGKGAHEKTVVHAFRRLIRQAYDR